MSTPEKPTLDGLEEKWSARWEADGTYAFDRTKTRAEVYSIDTPPPTVSGSLHIGHVFCVHPHRHHRPLPAHARARGLLPDGLGRQRPADRAPGAELLRRPVRPVAAVRPDFAPPAKPGKQRDPDLAGRNFVELCDRLAVEDEKAFEELWRRLGLSVDWSMTYTTIGERGPAGVAAGVPAQPRPRRGVPGRGADAVGRRLPHRGRPGRAGGPRAAGRVPPARVPTAPTATADIVIETTRPELLPACVALVAHPDDERYQPLFGHDGDARRCSASGARCVAHPLADPEKGSGIAMICTFGDTTDVMWWRELQLPTAQRASAATAACCADAARLGCATRPAADAALRRARGQDREAGAGPHRRAARRVRRAGRRAQADHATR